MVIFESSEDFFPGSVLHQLAGVDEAGRGPLAGPVFAAAVVVSEDFKVAVNDSKRLSATQREKLAQSIRVQAVDWAIGVASVEEIDGLNILKASLLAMKRALSQLRTPVVGVLIDGLHCPDVALPCRSLVRGDQCIRMIAAASIMAKVARDNHMRILDQEYPEYEFSSHKGYPTARHRELLQKYGPCIHHRKSFRPVSQCLVP